MQLGYLSIVLWYILLVLSNDLYLSTNAFVLGVIAGVLTGLLLQQIATVYIRRKLDSN